MLKFVKPIIFTLLLSNAAIGLAVEESRGIIEGRVFNAKNNEPVPFANVVIWGTNIGSVTDLDGNFLFTGLEPGFVELRVSSVGFKDYVSEQLQVTNAKKVFVEIPLEETNVQLDEVVVKASPFRRTEESPVSLRRIGIAEIEKNPGGNRDISRVIQSFPGVASSVSFRNDVIVRGGGAAENAFYLDGVEIPTINHFSTQGASGGPVGILNVDFIKEVNYYSGAFPANRGDALSSVFEFRQIDGNKERLKFRGAVGATDVALTMDGPLGDRTTFIASVRRSYLQILFAALELPFLPTFNDFQFKVKTRINDKNEVTFLGLGAIDRFRLNLDANETEEQRYILGFIPMNEQYSYTVGGVYKHFRSKGFDTWVVSRGYLNNTAYKYQNNIEEDSLLTFDYASIEIENKFRYEHRSIYDNGLKLNYGANLEYATYSNETFNKALFAGEQPLIIDYESNIDVVKYGLFAQVSEEFFRERLSLSLGARIDGNDYSEEMSNPLDQFSPRFSASCLLFNRFYVNFNTGRYYQMPPYTSLGFRDTTGTLVNKENRLKYLWNDQVVFGLEYLPAENQKITLEGFYKWYHDYPFSLSDSVSISSKGANFGTYGDEELISLADGRAYGMELFYRNRNLWDFDLNLILSYTLVWSETEEYDNNPDPTGDYIPTAWDNRHILNITAIKNFKRNWQIGLKWRFVGGAPYTPFDREFSSLRPVWDVRQIGVFDFNRFNGERLDAFHQLDTRVDKEYFFDKWTLNLYLDIQNVYNFELKNAPDLILNEDENGNPVILNPEAPYNQQRYDLKTIRTTSGTVIPTVGIIVEF